MDQSQLDPALIQQILSMEDMDQDPQAMQLARRQKMVDAMRGQMQAPQGQMVGRRFVAPSAISQIGSVIGQGMAGSQQKGIDQGMTDFGAKRTAGKTAYLQALQAALRRSTRPPQPAVGEIPPQGNGNDVSLGY